MKIAFFGKQGSFDYANIGGTNSLLRRLSEELTGRYGHQVDFVLYGTETAEVNHARNFRSCYYSTYSDALSSLTSYDHVVLIYLPIWDIPLFRSLCRRYKEQITFHNVYPVWPESPIKRKLLYFCNQQIPTNGYNFAVSNRINEELSKKGLKCARLWPPVPENYFKTLSDGPSHDAVNVTYIGRLDVDKGILETLDLFDKLSKFPEITLQLYGTYWETDPVAIKIHDRLVKQDVFPYYPVDFKSYTTEVDEMVRNTLFNTDIFIQPYRKLSSTIDTPLLILEAMAALCAVVTKPYGNIPDIYGHSPCLINGTNFVAEAAKLILQSDDWLDAEKERLNYQNRQLKFDVSNVANQFNKLILGDL